tara:strand:+ start:88 stop:414 length:327 start_codon:yes stop_codon:yes gene_type:complete
MDIQIVILKMYAQDQTGWLAIVDNKTIGHIFMREEANKTLKFLDAWVSDDQRRKGIYRKLWNIRWQYVKENYKGWNVYAWCKPTSLPLLLEKGFSKGDTCVYVEKVIK